MLSNSCKYGIRAVVYLANKPSSDGKYGIKQISGDLGLPSPFLSKILQLLARKKILCSSKGPNGGFSILKDPREITLLDIVNTIDGEEIFNNCVVHDGSCASVNKERKLCPLHKDYSRIRAELMQLFRKTTIYDLVKKADKSDTIAI